MGGLEDDMDDTGFEVELVEAADLGDENSYRLQNRPGGENQRQHIIQEGKRNDLTFHGDLFAVIHGTLTPDGDDATLIIMQFTFSGSSSYQRRFRKVEIMVKFANGEEKVGGDNDPEVRAIAPEGEFKLAEQSTEEVSTVLSAGISAPVAQGILEINAGIERGTTTTRTTRTTIFGGRRIENRRYGKQNAAHWKLDEDKIGQTGVPGSLRTAILVVPKTDDGFRAIVEIDVTAGLAFAAEVKTRRLLGKVKVDPVYFSNEREDFGPQIEGVDPDNLAQCKLAEIGLIKTSTII